MLSTLLIHNGIRGYRPGTLFNYDSEKYNSWGHRLPCERDLAIMHMQEMCCAKNLDCTQADLCAEICGGWKKSLAELQGWLDSRLH